MENNLREAALKGDINKLYESLNINPKILEEIDEIPFKNTPLHIAADAGHTHFAIEIMRLKPSFGKKLNPSGLSPLHLALRNKKTQTVKRLIKYDSELIRVKGKENFTPLHYVVETDQIDLLAEFLLACPPSIEDLTNRGESAVHIAVVNGKLEALKVLLGWLKRTNCKDVLNWKDENGNTVLHVAACSNNAEVLMLLSNKVNQDIGGKNSAGLTALEIISRSQLPNEVKKQVNKRLRCPPALRGLYALNFLRLEEYIRTFSAKDNTSLQEFLISPEGIFERLVRYEIHMQYGMSSELKNALLVIAVLLVTTAYQAALTPPNLNKGVVSTIPHIDKLAYNLSHKWNVFLTSNTITIALSTGIILRLLQTSPFTMLMQISLYIIFANYIYYVSFQCDIISLVAALLSALFIV